MDVTTEPEPKVEGLFWLEPHGIDEYGRHVFLAHGTLNSFSLIFADGLSQIAELLNDYELSPLHSEYPFDQLYFDSASYGTDGEYLYGDSPVNMNMISWTEDPLTFLETDEIVVYWA